MTLFILLHWWNDGNRLSIAPFLPRVVVFFGWSVIGIGRDTLTMVY